MSIAHLGVAVLIVGICGASAWKQERIESLKPGEWIEAGGYRVTFDGARRTEGPNYAAVTGTYTVTKDGVPVTLLTPERRNYAQPPQGTTEAAIHTTLTGDLYTVIGEPDGADGAFVTRVFIEPFVPWLWAGVLLMGLGGLVSLTDRRFRVGAARKPALPPQAVPAE
jgi:cytochrome c-type biogenesis protein CcmF